MKGRKIDAEGKGKEKEWGRECMDEKMGGEIQGILGTPEGANPATLLEDGVRDPGTPGQSEP